MCRRPWDVPSGGPRIREEDEEEMKISRAWAMPSSATFTIKPIADLISRWVCGVSVDPFAGDNSPATIKNDLNGDKPTQFHEDALSFLEKQGSGVADTVIMDPPYSPRQITECYRGMGLKATQFDTNRTHWKPERDQLDRILKVGGIAVSFGWNSSGMGIKRGYEIEEILLVCHGGGHNDTICVVERKLDAHRVD